MDETTPRRIRGAWARDVFAQVFADRRLIQPGQFCAYNGFLGLILIGAGVVLLADPVPGFSRPSDGIALLASGAILVTALLMPLVRPSIVRRWLAFQGLIILGLTTWFLAGGIRWAMGSPARHTFKYIPGPILLGFTYGALQLAEFGPWRSRPKLIRISGFVLGVIGEIVFGAVFALGLLRR